MPWIHFHRSMLKHVQIGDIQQLPTIVLSDSIKEPRQNIFSPQVKTSYMERMQKCEYPIYQLHIVHGSACGLEEVWSQLDLWNEFPPEC